MFNNNWVPSYHYRGAVSYVTGAHSVKVGFNEAVGYIQRTSTTSNTITRRRRPQPGPVPVGRCNRERRGRRRLPTANQVTDVRDVRTTSATIRTTTSGFFAQDKWTMNKLTLNYGLRFDWFKSSYPDQSLVTRHRSRGGVVPTAAAASRARISADVNTTTAPGSRSRTRKASWAASTT